MAIFDVMSQSSQCLLGKSKACHRSASKYRLLQSFLTRNSIWRKKNLAGNGNEFFVQNKTLFFFVKSKIGTNSMSFLSISTYRKVESLSSLSFRISSTIISYQKFWLHPSSTNSAFEWPQIQHIIRRPIRRSRMNSARLPIDMGTLKFK